MSKLDDILRERGVYSAGVERGDAVLHGLTNDEAKRKIQELMLEVIGEDEDDKFWSAPRPGLTLDRTKVSRNELRSELKSKVNKL